MHRHFYSFATFLNIVVAIFAIAEALAFSQVGNVMYYAQSYPKWLLGAVLFSILEAFVLLKYLRIKQNNKAFLAGVPYHIFAACTILLSYSMMELASGAQFYVAASLLTLLFQVIYGVVLTATVPRQNPWLKGAGAYLALLGLVTLILSSLVLTGTSNEVHSRIETFHGPVLWAAVVVPVVLAVNFYRDLQSTPRETVESPAFYTFSYPIIGMMVLYLIALFLGDAIGSKKWIPEMESQLMKAAEAFEARSFVNTKGDSLKYRFLKPLDFDPAKKYPVVVCLHGSSGTGNDNYRQVVTSLMPELLMTESNRQQYPAFIFIPQAPFGTSWGGAPVLPGIDQIVFDALASLEKEFPIDTDRRYVTGISLGGYGTWHFIESHPEMFAAAVPICGGGDPEEASKCANVPTWAFHGANDNRVPVSGSRDMINAMKAAGGNPKYTEYPDTGHEIGKLVVETPGLLDWLFAQHK